MLEPATSPERIGPYRILEPLGHGGMGVVYRARHEQSGELAALKTVRVPRPALLAGIRREVHALRRLRHPGIVRVLDEGLEQGVPWYAMELLEGVTLRQHLARSGQAHTESEPDVPQRWWTQSLAAGSQRAAGIEPVPAAGRNRPRVLEVLAIVRRLCAPLAFLHGEGLVHRDLKPDNILVRYPTPDARSPNPVLLDFGLAVRFGGELSREALEVESWSGGTLAFMAPEQVRGELADARADLYALGCILYWGLTGRMPFGTAAQVEDAAVETVPPSALAEGVGEQLDELVLRLLRKSPRERLGHADAVAAALAALEEAALPEAEVQAPRARAYLYRPELAGRRALVEALGRHAVAQLRARVGGLMLVGGESGIGKTRLALELARRVQALASVQLLGGECSIGGGPLHPLRVALQRLADRCREGGPEQTERLLGPRGRVLAPYEPALAELPGQGQYPALAELPPQEARLRLFVALAEALAALAAEQPVLLILDDLQWSDELTAGFLEFWLQTLQEARRPVALQIVGTYRTEEAGESLRRLAAAPQARAMRLERLDESAVGSMVGDMLAMAPPPAVLSRFLTRQSEGNPFFVAEYLRLAVAEGLLDRDAAGRWQVAEPAGAQGAAAAAAEDAVYAALPLPGSVRELVGRRLAGLGRPARRLVDTAAVLGRELDARLLDHASGLSAVELLEALQELLSRQALTQLLDGSIRFEHDKIREVAYEQLDEGLQRTLHRAVAVAIEEVLAQEREAHLADLGRHWEAAGEPDKARPCHLAAARQARDRYGWGEAEALYRAYLRLCPQPSAETVTAQMELGEDVLGAQGRAQPAIEEQTSALEQARKLGAAELEGKILGSLGNLYRISGQVDLARTLLTESLSILRKAGHTSSEASVLRFLGILHFDQSRFEECGQLFESALEIHRRSGDRKAQGLVLGNLAHLLQVQGRTQAALGLFEQALGAVRETGDRRVEGVVLGNLARLHYQQGRKVEGRRLFEQALRIHDEVGDRRFKALNLERLANMNQEQGRIEEARSMHEQALGLHRQAGERIAQGPVFESLGALHQDQGRFAEARACYEQALAIFRDVRSPGGEGRLLGYMSTLCQDEGDLDAAQALAEQSLGLLRQIGDSFSVASVLAFLAEQLAEQGRVEEARATLQQTLVAVRQRGQPELTANALCVQSRLERRTSARFEGSLAPAIEAEALLRQTETLLKLVLCLCEQGHLALAGGRSAGPWLDQAEPLALTFEVQPRSRLGRALGRLRRAQEAFAAGELGRLFRGELIDDLPEGLRRWLIQSGQLGEQLPH